MNDKWAYVTAGWFFHQGIFGFIEYTGHLILGNHPIEKCLFMIFLSAWLLFFSGMCFKYPAKISYAMDGFFDLFKKVDDDK